MELLLVLFLGVFAGGFIMWAWLTINRRMDTPLNQHRLDFHQQVELQLDAERTRISSELHDDIIQRLSGIRLSLLHITALHTIPTETEAKIKQLASDLTETIQTTQVLIWKLSLAEVENKSLVVVLQNLCSKIGKASDLKINFLSVTEERERPLSDLFKEEIHRIVQEAVHNAVKYSNGWQVTVTLQWHYDRLSIAVEDDGEGIKKKNHDGFGMENLHRRANKIGASLEILPNRPKGTVVKLELLNDSLMLTWNYR
jgi:signal transduction histidine kinase